MTTTNEPAEAITGELAFAAPIVPLLQAARDRRNQTVKLHIPDIRQGGASIEVEGRLTHLNEDDMTITVVDKDAEYDIPLHRIAIIEAAR